MWIVNLFLFLPTKLRSIFILDRRWRLVQPSPSFPHRKAESKRLPFTWSFLEFRSLEPLGCSVRFYFINHEPKFSRQSDEIQWVSIPWNFFRKFLLWMGRSRIPRWQIALRKTVFVHDLYDDTDGNWQWDTGDRWCDKLYVERQS